MTREEILPIAKPILFNTDMVRAILEDRKTETRRILRLPKYIKEQSHGLYTLFAEGTCYENRHLEEIIDYIKLLYNVGDYLYIRETWSFWPCWDCDIDCNACRTSWNNTDGCFVYRIQKQSVPYDGKWHPSIHIPKEAARIFLKVTDVRVERLQDISGHGVLAEGVDNGKSNPAMGIRWENMQRIAFSELWNSTIPKKDLEKYGWNANPWVWVIEFEKVEVQ